MKKTVSIIFATLMAISFTPAFARGVKNTESADTLAKKKFNTHTLVEKGEHMVSFGISYTNLDTDNSSLMLIANNANAKASLFKLSPGYSYAYAKNASIGIRFDYTSGKAVLGNINLSLLSPDLSFDFKDINGRINSYSGVLVHRNYLGLEKTGTVGLFLETALGYKYSTMQFVADSYSASHQIKLALAPGLKLYINNFVSLEMAIGVADVTYSSNINYSAGKMQGGTNKLKGTAGLSLLNSYFGIVYQF